MITPPKRPRTWRDSLRAGLLWAGLALLIAYVWASFSVTKFNLYELAAGAPHAVPVLRQLAHPDLGWTRRDASGSVVLDPLTGRPEPGTLRTLLLAMNLTVMTGLLGTLLALPLSFALAFPAARNLTRATHASRAAYALSRGVLNVLRAIEPIILGIIFIFIIGPGAFAAVMALTLHSVGSLGKLFAEAIEQSDPLPVEAVRATGASNFLCVWFGVVPQVAPQMLAFALYRWDLNIRMGIVLGIVGAGGIGLYIKQYIDQFQYEQCATALLIILIAVSVLDWASGALRERLG